MYVVENRSAALENVVGFASLDAYTYIRFRNRMVALGYVYTLGNNPPPERCTSRNAISAEFLEVETPPHILVYDWDL